MQSHIDIQSVMQEPVHLVHRWTEWTGWERWTCVPQALICFLDSENFEDAIRKAVSLGGDSDTLACITGGMAEAYYKKIPKSMADRTKVHFPRIFTKILDEMYEHTAYKKYC